MSAGIGDKVQGLHDGLDDVQKPEINTLRQALKKYIEAEKGYVKALDDMRKEASKLEVHGRTLMKWAEKATGADAEAYKKRGKDLSKAMDGISDFTDGIDGILEGSAAGKIDLPGEAVQAVLDKLEFTDKAATKDFRKAAQAYYPLESAGKKKLQEWSVRLGMLAKAINEGLASLNPDDKVEALNLSFGKFEVLKPALELKKKIDGLGV